MGRFYPKRLADLERVDAGLRVTCTACDHTGLYVPREVVGYFRHKGLNDDWTIAGSYFRCSACDHRGARLGWEPLFPQRGPAPEPIESVDQRKMRQRRERG